MPIDAEKMVLSRTHRDNSNWLSGERFERQMIEQVFQRAGEGPAIDRARDDHAVRRAHALDDRGGIIVVLFGRPAVGKRNFLAGQVDQIDLKVLPRLTRGIEQPSRRIEQPSRRRDASYNR